MGQDEGEVLQVQDDGAVRVVTIDRPHRRNAVDHAVAFAMGRAIDEFEAADDLLVLVVTGASGTFCSGMDLNAHPAGKRPIVPGRGFAGIVEQPPRKPVIAAVEGYAVGGGFEIVLACDLVVAARNAVFALPEVRRGLVPGGGGLLRLAERIPYVFAQQMALTGEPLPAIDAHRLGLINTLTDPGTALDTARQLAAQIVRNAPLAVLAAKELLRKGSRSDSDDAWQDQRRTCETIRLTEDAREGATAFLQKREPRWTGG
ncbi:MAG: enoyl-CoA hydratase [Actinomycetota bacterium]|nr:enoyl-CoA hydratase [Actinomycetota bacterium]